jgi:hypothetical protein
MASYAVPAQDQPDDVDADVMWRSVMPDLAPGVQVRTEVVEGLAARILLDRSDGADMLILGTASDTDDALRSAGPVIRACLRRALCPVVVISVAQDPLPREDTAELDTEVQLPVRLPVGAGVGAGVGGGGVRIPAPAGIGVPVGSAKGVPVPAGA